MNTEFSKPQRQSAIGIIIMAANTMFQLIKALIVPLIISLSKVNKGDLFYFFLAFLALLIIVIIFAYLNYRKFTFHLNDEKQEFVVNKGIFNRTQLTIQLEKIQQVNINQNLLQKIIGIYGLKIDTAGSDGQEVSILAIDENIAHSLREHLLNRKTFDHQIEETTSNIENTVTIPLLKVSPLTLFKVGLTSNYGSSIALLIAFVYPLFHNVKEILNALKMDEGQVEHAVESIFTFFSLTILLGIILALILVINIVRTFVKYFDFHISKHKHSLLISAGLFAKKNTLLSPDKVQTTTYSQNYFQKKMNLLNMNLKQAASGHATNGKEIHSTNLEIPGCSVAEKDELLMMILGKNPPKSAIFKPNFRFLNLPIFFRVILPIAIFFIFWTNTPEIKSFYPLAILYFLLAIPMIYISYRRHRIMVDQDFIIKKSGIWDITHEIILPHKIQAITTFQYPWHKSVDVGHVNLHTAAGIIHFKYGNYTEIKQLVNYWLYQIESGSKEWM